MSLEQKVRSMPKVELHVHLEGAVRAETLLALARRNRIGLPAESAEELRLWYRFRNFAEFGRAYTGVAACICTPDDIEQIARELLVAQAAQNVIYSEVTYTALTQYYMKGLAFCDQLAAINRARVWGERELGVTMRLVIDIPRPMSSEDGLLVAGWAIEAMADGVVALGLAGPELGHPAEKFAAAFRRAREAGLPVVPHAGETAGAASIREAVALGAARIGHGVRCLEDPELVRELRSRQVVLEVCPTSNVKLGVVPSLAHHPLPELLAQGLSLTLNSDDPALFDTTLTDELLAAGSLGLAWHDLADLTVAAAEASLLPAGERQELVARVQSELAGLAAEPA
jgi:adenosine deaminase